MVYNAKGAPKRANLTKDLTNKNAEIDNSWGLDHGTWSVLCKMYPKADIPVYQLSVDSSASAENHFQIGQEVNALREKGVLIFGSGNVVHNLGRISWEMKGGEFWAGKYSELAFPTPEHFYPLIYVLGASNRDDQLLIFNDSCVLGSLSMTSYLFSQVK